jgi:hypothetical protein
VRRQAELLRGEDLGGDDAEHGAAALAIEEDVGAEPAEALDLVGEVGVVPARELFGVGSRHDRVEQRDHLRRRDRRGAFLERLNPAVLADQRRHRRRQVQVRGLRVDHQSKQPIDCRAADGSEGG